MKKLVPFLLAALLLSILTGCGGSGSAKTESPAAPADSQATDAPVPTEEPVPEAPAEEDILAEAEKLYYEDHDFEGAYALMQSVDSPALPALLSFMGDCCYNGIGTAADGEEAFRLYSLAARQDSGLGLFGLGICTRFGAGTERDKDKSNEILLQAVDKLVKETEQESDPYTLGRIYYSLGHCYLYNQGVERDPALAEEYLKKAVEYKNPSAMEYLGQILSQRGDETEALKYHAAAADGGDAMGAINAGLQYLRGIGTDPDPALAVQYLQMAKDRGVPDPDLDGILQEAQEALNARP